MKKCFIVFAVFLIAFNAYAGFIVEDDDNIPYLSDEDMEALEYILPFDEPDIVRESLKVVAEPEESADETASGIATVTEESFCTDKCAANEIARLNSSRSIYHLLILDRIHSPLKSDICGLKNITVLYKFLHGDNGYLIAIYKSADEGPVFPVLPENSNIIVNFSTVQKSMIQDYVNSAAFKRLVTNKAVLAEIGNLFTADW